MAASGPISIGPSGKRPEELQIPVLEPIEGPGRGLARVAVEVVAVVETGTDAIVIAPHNGGRRTETTEPIQDRVGRRAVADRVTEKRDAIETLAPDVAQDRLEGLPVRVDIGQDQEAHAASASASAIRSATSTGDFVAVELEGGYSANR